LKYNKKNKESFVLGINTFLYCCVQNLSQPAYTIIETSRQFFRDEMRKRSEREREKEMERQREEKKTSF
jgi:hypothetical protein